MRLTFSAATLAVVLGAAGCGGGSSSSPQPAPPPPAPAPPPGELQLAVERMHVVQVTQDANGEVPLFADRAGLLRVFVTANQNNSATPAVRVDIFHDGTQTSTHTIESPRSFVPTTVEDHLLDSSWNVVLPAADLRPGLAVRATVAPGGAAIAHPASGPLALDVRAVEPFRGRFVPVRYGDQTAIVNDGVIELQTVLFRRTFPFSELDIDVGATYTTTAVNSNGTINMSDLLAELHELRADDGSDRYYYGNVHWPLELRPAHAGIAYLGFPVGLGQNGNSFVYAHELGHNLSLRHAPCGNAPNPDPGYPYQGGAVGVPGWDIANGQLRGPSERDLMSYCRSQPNWISDYHFRRAFDFIPSTDAAKRATSAAPALVIWGSIDGDGITLSPAYVGAAGRDADTGSGPLTVEGHDEFGEVLFSRAFDAVAVMHGTDGERHFSVRIPLADAHTDRLVSVHVHGDGSEASLFPTRAAITTDNARPTNAERVSDGVRLRWDADRFPLAVVRHPETGMILSFARGGDVVIATDAPTLDIGLSDGVRELSGSVSVHERR